MLAPAMLLGLWAQMRVKSTYHAAMRQPAGMSGASAARRLLNSSGLHQVDIDEFPNVKRWFESIHARPAVQRGVALLADQMKIGNPSDETREMFFGDAQYSRRH